MPRRTALVLICLCVGAGGVVAQDDGPKPLKMGVVDIGVLFKQYGRKDDLEQAINRERDSMRDELTEEHVALKKERQSLGELPPSKARDDAEQALRERYRKLEFKQKEMEKQLERRVEEHTLVILEELKAAIADHGKQHGYTVILKVDANQASPFQEQIFREQISDVLFYDGGIDCTKQVLALLNDPANLERMRKQGKKSGSF